MSRSVYKSEEGRRLIEAAYREHLNSTLGAGLVKRTVETDMGSTFVLEKSGAGKPPVLLLHGSVSNSASWLGIIPFFTERFSVYCLDIPGEPGLSSPKRFSLKSDSPALWLRGALDALGLEKAAFLGMSLGGWYALNFAVKYPERVGALSLISGGGIGPEKPGFIFKAMFYLLLGKKGQRLLNKAIYHKVEMPKEILEYQALVSRHFRPVNEGLPRFSDDEIRSLRMPLQYFGGAQDALLDAKTSVERLSALLPHAEAHLLEDTGHAIIDKFDAVYEFLIRAWGNGGKDA
ncbi:MAG: alpha/beta hydrolase [Spirochaetia bacterium]|jgi:pimeloyl-ACP methyl ester carboxylesterase|nr:alpha/beta hydrolase [Spirochaetia bacterium]